MAGTIESRIALRGDIADVMRKMSTYQKNVYSVNKKVSNSFANTNKVAGQLSGLLAGMGLGLGLKKIINTAGDFQNAMARVKAITKATDEDFQLLRNTALQMGKSTIYSSSQAAQALQELGMAGLNANQSAALLPQTLELATAGAIELSEAASIVTGVISGMGLKVSDAARVNDVLAAAATNAKTDITQLGEGFANVGSTAKVLNLNLEDTTTLISLMAQANINGAEAGNALKSSLLRLAAPTAEVIDALKEVGISTQDLANYINNGDIMGFFEKLRTEMSSMSASDQGAILSGLFGKNQAGKMAAIIGSTSAEVDRISKAINNSKGAAQQMARDGIGPWQKGVKLLESAVEGLLIKLGEGGLLDFVTKFINNASTLIGSITDITGSFDNAIPVLYAFGTAATIAWAALTGGISAIVTAVAAASVGFITYWNDIVKAIENSINAVIDFVNQFSTLKITVVTVVEIIKQLGTVFYETIVFISKLLYNIGDLIFNVFKNAYDAVKGLFTGEDFDFVDALTDSINNAFDTIKKDYSNMSNYLDQELDKSIKNVVDTFNGKEIAHVKLNVSTVSDDNSLTDNSNIKPIEVPAKVHIEALNIGENSFPELDDQLEIIDSVITKQKELQDVAQSVNSSVSDAFNQLGNNIINSLDVAENGMGGFLKTLGSTVMKLLSMYMASALSASIAGGAESGAATGPAAIATTPAFIATLVGGVMSAFAAIPKFEYGGIVGGSSYYGDKILARVNSKELILNREQQASLYHQLDSGGSIPHSIRLYAKGADLEGMFNYNSKKNKSFRG